MVLSLWCEDVAPALRVDFPFDHFAAARGLKKATIVAVLCAFWRILVFDRCLRHLVALCESKPWDETKSDRCT